jgi:8-oxo-dGTP pyrophosphatase MutT (NUDIX family)
MRERPSARVILLDPDDRILLLQGRLPATPDGPQFWFTVGGGIEDGETLDEAALREIVEETGLLDAALGPAVWRDEIVLPDQSGELMLLKQTYRLAHTAGGQLSRAGWQDLERAFTDDIRWWTLEELRASGETFYPIGLAELLADVLAGRIASEPLLIATPDGPVAPLPRPA